MRNKHLATFTQNLKVTETSVFFFLQFILWEHPLFCPNSENYVGLRGWCPFNHLVWIRLKEIIKLIKGRCFTERNLNLLYHKWHRLLHCCPSEVLCQGPGESQSTAVTSPHDSSVLHTTPLFSSTHNTTLQFCTQHHSSVLHTTPLFSSAYNTTLQFYT